MQQSTSINSGTKTLNHPLEGQCVERKSFFSSAVLAGFAVIAVGVIISLIMPLSPLSSWDFSLLGIYGLIAVSNRVIERKLAYTSFKNQLLWFDFGCGLLLIVSLVTNPLCALGCLVVSEIVSRWFISYQRPQASILNTASEFIGFVLATAAFSSTGLISETSSTIVLVFAFAAAASVNYLVSESSSVLLFSMLNNQPVKEQFVSWLKAERKRHFVFATTYLAFVAITVSLYLKSDTLITAMPVVAMLALAFFIRLWDTERRTRQSHEENQQEETLQTQQLNQSQPQTATNNQHLEPVSWSLASMVFKVLHTNQDRFVRHSLVTGRLCEMVARELEVQLGDTVDIDPEESWVIGVLHDVGLMDQPTQVLRFAERVERPIDLEIYEEKKEGGMMHLNLVDHRLPKVTSEDTDVLDEHPKIGAQLLAGWPNVAKVIEQHHAFSTDYDQLPLLAQILFVCEKYELLASENGYYTTVSKDEAIDAIKEEYESIQEHPQVLNALITVLHNHDETFWNATDLDYDQQVQIIAPRLKTYANKQAHQSAPDQPKQTELKSFHPFERHRAYTTPTPHTDNSLS